MAEFVLTITLPSDIVINSDHTSASHMASQVTMCVINYLSRIWVGKLFCFFVFIAYRENVVKELDMLISLACKAPVNHNALSPMYTSIR